MGPLPDIRGLLRILFPLAAVGLLAVAAAVIWGLIWLAMHVRFV